MVRGELPASVQGHYGERLGTAVRFLHHHGRVTQPLLLEMLQEWGIDIPVLSLSKGRRDKLMRS